MPHRRVGRFLRRTFRPSRRVARARRARIVPVAKRILTQPLATGLTTGTIPISPVGAVGVVGGAGGKIGGFIKGVGLKIQKFGKPVTFKTGVQSVGSRFLKGLGITTGVTAIETAITGEPFNPLGRRPILGAAGFAVGGVPGLVAGSLLGGIKVGTREAVKLGVGGASFVGGQFPSDPFGNFPFLPPQQAGNTVNIDFGDAPAVVAPAVGGLTGGGGASFQIGTAGGGDLTGLILLLLGLGGVGAFVATRKKRKKKKKKKKRKKLKRKLRELEEDE